MELSTEDCFGGQVRSVDDLPSQVCEFPYLNPVTGPIHVEGAEPGDTLAVHLVEIAPARDWAVSATFPHFGALTATHSTAMLHEPLEELVWVYDVDRRRGHLPVPPDAADSEVELPLDPMHGTVGVAPAGGRGLTSITPGAHGGNMDTPEMRAGTTAYFGVNVAGRACSSLGDGHCRQGEGEVCGTAVEAAMHTVVVVDLIKGGAPRLAADRERRLPHVDRLRPAARGRLPDQPARPGHWAAELTRPGTRSTPTSWSARPGLRRPATSCDTNYTMVAKVAKSLLGGASAYDGVHARLREIGERHLASR